MDGVIRDPDFSKITEGTTFKKALGDIKEVGMGQEKDHSREIIVVAEIEAQAIVG